MSHPHKNCEKILALLVFVLMAAKGMPHAARAQTFAGESVDGALTHFDRPVMAKADKLIEQTIAQGQCPGVVLLVGRNDGILYEKAYGNSTLKPAPLAMRDDTIFDLASLTKPLATSTSIMILAERGLIRIEDPVAKYLPDFAANGKEKITIADLLLHVGGLPPDNDLSDFAEGKEKAMARTLAVAPQWKRGERFAYSDVGFIVLGELVHKVSGRPLDTFARDEIFRPLGMDDTGYNPAERVKARSAPTEQRDGRWMQGEVHDPRAYALGGVAGHAGVFSTARDLSRFCRMILDGGALDGVRILNPRTVAKWTRPRLIPGGDHRTYGFDVDTPYAGIRGERFERGTTFGHTGFTGTAFWIDPFNRCYFILLTNSVHPNGKGNVLRLRHDIATIVAEALLGPALVPGGGGSSPAVPDRRAQTLCGIDVLERDAFRPLAGRKVALITNQTGRDHAGLRSVDLLAGAKDVRLIRLFSPEHGIDGILDEKISNSSDARTGLAVLSLYGAARKPTPQMLQGVDTLVFDIQDVGTRFYTYITTLGLCMQAAAENKIKFVVLDRPNPNTGLVADGAPADAAHLGFTAFGALPLVHGMTIGELARYYNGEFKIGCDLEVVPMENWRRRMWWDETALTWTNPSPNLRNPTAALLYPAVGLLEATNISMGRGTDQPFEIFGAPWIDAQKLALALNEARLAGLRFVPIAFTPNASKFANEKCQGVYIQVTDRNAFEPARAGVAIAWTIQHLFGEKFQSAQVGNMLQNTQAAAALESAKDWSAAASQWRNDIEAFRKKRQNYLLYQ